MRCGCDLPKAASSDRLDRQARQGRAAAGGTSRSARSIAPRSTAAPPNWLRDGIIQLTGQRLSTGAQIALRGIFSHTFSKKTPWNLMPERLATDPSLADVGITQFVIDDGWIGVALGEQRVALRSAPRPK